MGPGRPRTINVGGGDGEWPGQDELSLEMRRAFITVTKLNCTPRWYIKSRMNGGDKQETLPQSCHVTQTAKYTMWTVKSQLRYVLRSTYHTSAPHLATTRLDGRGVANKERSCVPAVVPLFVSL